MHTCPLPSFKWIVQFPSVDLHEFCVYFGYYPFIGCSKSGISFYHVYVFDNFLDYAKTFQFDVVQFVYFCICFPCLKRHI